MAWFYMFKAIYLKKETLNVSQVFKFKIGDIWLHFVIVTVCIWVDPRTDIRLKL